MKCAVKELIKVVDLLYDLWLKMNFKRGANKDLIYGHAHTTHTNLQVVDI